MSCASGTARTRNPPQALNRPLKLPCRIQLRRRSYPKSSQQKQEILITLRQVVDAFKAEPWFAVVDVGNTLQRLITMDTERFFLLLKKGTLGQDWDRRLAPELARISCPVLAIWGEEDAFLPPRQSAARLEKYISDAGHQAYTIRILPGAGHGLICIGSPAEFVPGYFDTINTWLDQHLDSH
jgi:pimeloyl-ACP methyl ester carboxylesterase